MIVVNSKNDSHFTLNGIEYFRVYLNEVKGDSVRMFNCFTSFDTRVDFTPYDQFIVNGNSFASVALLQIALNTVTFNKFNGGTSPTPNISQVLAVAGDRPLAIVYGSFVLANRTQFTTFDSDITLDGFLAWQENDLLRFAVLDTPSTVTSINGANIFLPNGDNTPIGSFTVDIGDICELFYIGSDSWYLFQYSKEKYFELQFTQTTVDDAPTILEGSIIGARGATITPSHFQAGIYRFTANLPIFADLKDCYKRTDYFDLQILQFDFGGQFSWYWYCVSDTVLEVVVFDGVGDNPSPADEFLTNNVKLRAEYKF